ncbi:MAG: AMP-binding protein [Bacillota bacterium]|nr:AMP-binding protein [Bacillota bacterium]
MGKSDSSARELQQILKEKGVISFDEFISFGKNRKDSLDIPFVANETAVLVTTGGSTGPPKMIELTNENFNSLMEQYKGIFGRQKEKVFAGELPPWVAFGLASGMHMPNSLSLILMINPDYDFTKFPQRYLITKPTYTAVTPLHLSLLMEEIVAREKTRAIDVLEKAEDLTKTSKQELIEIVKTAKVNEFFNVVKQMNKKLVIPQNTMTKLENIFEDLSFNKHISIGGNKVTSIFRRDSEMFFTSRGGDGVFQGLGTSEACTTLAMDIPAYKNCESTGVVMPYNDVEVRDPKTNELLGFNRKGLIAFSGPTHGHYTNPENSKKTNYMSRGKRFVSTGDTAWLNMDGTVGFEGRHSRMIIIDGGFNINPERTEEVLAKIPYIKESMVVGATIENMQQTIAIAHIVLSSDKELSDHDREEIIKDIYQQLDGKIPEHYMPAIIKIDKQLMRTNRGKPDFISTARADEEELNRSGFKMEKGKGYGKSIQVT